MEKHLQSSLFVTSPFVSHQKQVVNQQNNFGVFAQPQVVASNRFESHMKTTSNTVRVQMFATNGQFSSKPIIGNRYMGLTTMSASKIQDGYGAKQPSSFGFKQTMLKHNPLRNRGTSSTVVMQSSADTNEVNDDMDAKFEEREAALLKKEKELYQREKLIELEEKMRQKELELDERQASLKKYEEDKVSIVTPASIVEVEQGDNSQFSVKSDEPGWIKASMEADDELEQLGSVVKRDPVNGRIDFDQFLKIMEISQKYGINRFADKKKEMIEERRQARSQKDDTKYEKIVSEMIQREQMMVQSKLTEITKKLGISDSDFQQAATFWSQDQSKSMQLMQIQQNTIGNLDSYPAIARDKAIEVFKTQLDINLGQIDTMLKDPQMSKEATSQFEQMQVMMKIMMQKAKASDQLFEETGVEEDQLNAAIQKLGLQYDYEFMQMVNDNMQTVKKKADDAGVDPSAFGGIM